MYWQSEKKLIKQQYVLHMSPQHGELRPTKGWDRFWSLGHHSKFQRVSRLAFITAATLLTRGRPNCTMFGHLLRWYTTYTFSGAVAFWQNFARCKIHFKSKPCIRLYWQCYCTALQQRSSAKLWGSCRRNGIAELMHRVQPIFGRVAITLGIGPHSSWFHRSSTANAVRNGYVDRL